MRTEHHSPMGQITHAARALAEKNRAGKLNTGYHVQVHFNDTVYLIGQHAAYAASFVVFKISTYLVQGWGDNPAMPQVALEIVAPFDLSVSNPAV